MPLSLIANDLPWKNIVKVHVSIRTIYDGMVEVSTAENKKCACNCSKDSSSDNYFGSFESYSFDFDTCFWRRGGWIIMLNDSQAEKLMKKLLELFTNQVKSMVDYVEEVKDCHGCE
jgi:hypothetical protein